MAKTQKAKSAKGTRNDERKNGKANKQGGAIGSKRTQLTEGQKVLLGGGMLARWDRHNKNEALTMKARERKKKTPEVFDI